jgi:hypothetical protein
MPALSGGAATRSALYLYSLFLQAAVLPTSVYLFLITPAFTPPLCLQRPLPFYERRSGARSRSLAVGKSGRNNQPSRRPR